MSTLNVKPMRLDYLF